MAAPMMQTENLLLGITGNGTSFCVHLTTVRRDRKPSVNINSGYRSGHVYEWYTINRVNKLARTLGIWGVYFYLNVH
jgi:hypothetical protein